MLQLPLGQEGRAALSVRLAINEAAFPVEVVVDVGVDGSDLLQGPHSPVS